MRRIVLITAAALLVCASSAQAATTWVIDGRGWGHGVGMSQYGAYGYARHGSSYSAILRHYYRGTRITRTEGGNVRILLQASDPYVRFSGANRVGRKELNPATTYVVRRASGDRIVIRSSRGTYVGTFPSRIHAYRRGHAIRLLGRAMNGLTDGRYRGAIQLRHGLSGGVTAINSLGIDSYVQGVVASEMPASWHGEALKAQAVAARSYALATRNRGGVFDLYPDTRSQVYRGVAAETRSTNAAVARTSLQVVTYDGRVATTYFFSTSGGETENAENVFGSAVPYLKGVADRYDSISPRHQWQVRLSSDQMDSRLGSYCPGRFSGIRVLERGVSPRVVQARVYCTDGSRTISGATLRSRLGLYDSWVSFTRVSSSAASPARAAASGLGVRVPSASGVEGVFPPGFPGR